MNNDFKPNRYRPVCFYLVISINRGCYFSSQKVLVKYLNSLSDISMLVLS